jgi:hypothetical protein
VKQAGLEQKGGVPLGWGVPGIDQLIHLIFGQNAASGVNAAAMVLNRFLFLSFKRQKSGVHHPDGQQGLECICD